MNASTPSDNTGRDAADPRESRRHREERIGSAGGGPYGAKKSEADFGEGGSPVDTTRANSSSEELAREDATNDDEPERKVTRRPSP